MVYYGNKKKGGGNFEPRNNHGSMVISAQDRVKIRMLLLRDEAEDNMEEYIGYKMLGKIPAMVAEKCRGSLIKLFINIRPHINNYIKKQEQRLHTIKNTDKRNDILEILKYTKSNFEILDSSYGQIIRGNLISEDKIYELLFFLGQFLYDLGVTKIEYLDRDPIAEFAESAYGESFEEDGVE